MMALFPQSFCAPTSDASFAPLFRLLDDFDNYSREVQSTKGGRQTRPRQSRPRLPAFNPRFDVRETETAYELLGELPGIERENVNIEFTEPQTITIRGRIERSYGPETNNTTASADKETAAEAAQAAAAAAARRNSHQPTVEDDPEEQQNTPALTPATTPKTDVATPATQGQEVAKAPTRDEPRYWLWERAVGDFSRSFTFPTRVDHDGVSASLNNGILTVTVPKAKQPATRRIAIN